MGGGMAAMGGGHGGGDDDALARAIAASYEEARPAHRQPGYDEDAMLAAALEASKADH